MQALRWAVLLLAVVSALAFLVLAVLAFNQQFFDFDHAAHDLIRSGPYPQLRPLMQTLSRIGSGYVLIPLTVVAYVLLKRRGHRAARYIPAMLVGAFAVLALTKWIVARPRPKLSPYGFPSATPSARSSSSAAPSTCCGRWSCARSGDGWGRRHCCSSCWGSRRAGCTCARTGSATCSEA